MNRNIADYELKRILSTEKWGTNEKYRVVSISFKNIRNFKDVNIKIDPNKTTFFMMPNGTGKTTSIELLRAAFSKSALNWEQE